jgi:hypothetical protein
VTLVRTDVSEKHIIRVTRIGELETIAVTTDRILRSVFRLLVTATVVLSLPILVAPTIEFDTFLRNVGSYKSHTA